MHRSNVLNSYVSLSESHNQHQPPSHPPSSSLSVRQSQDTPAVIGSTNVGTLPNVANLTSKTQQNSSPKHSSNTSGNSGSGNNSNSSSGSGSKGCGNAYKSGSGKLATKRDRKESYSNNSAGNGNFKIVFYEL